MEFCSARTWAQNVVRLTTVFSFLLETCTIKKIFKYKQSFVIRPVSLSGPPRLCLGILFSFVPKIPGHCYAFGFLCASHALISFVSYNKHSTLSVQILDLS